MSYKKLLILPLILVVTFPVVGKTVSFVDQHGKALPDVVVTTQLSVDREDSDPPPVIMDQVNKQFVPHVLLINKGQRVAFPNSDNIRHHVYSFSEAKPFEIKLYSGDSAAPVSFDKSGVVVLGCNIHDSMIGYIYVNDDRQAWLTDQSGQLDLPMEIDQVEVWHPHLNVIKTKKQSVTLDNEMSPQVVTLELQAIPKEPERSSTFGKRTFGS